MRDGESIRQAWVHVYSRNYIEKLLEKQKKREKKKKSAGGF
jgi:hypothetical protein